VYDSTSAATVLTLGSNGVLSGDSVTFADTGATFIDKNVGTAKQVTISGITAGSTDGGNYSVNSSATTSANISPAIVNLSGTRVYDANTDANASVFGTAGTVNTGIGGETLVLSGAGTLASKNAGAESLSGLGSLTLHNGSGAAGNYTLIGGTDSVNVTKLAVTVSGTGTDKIYDRGVNDAVTLASSGVFVGDTVNFSDTSATFADKNAGTAKTVTISGIAASGADSGNYTLNNTSTTTTAAITPLSIAVAGTANNKVYDGTTTAAVLTLGSAGVLAGDTVTFADTGASFADKNAGTAKTVTISGITAGGTDAGNYSINPLATTAANITPLGIVVTGTANNKVYDGATTAAVLTLGSSGVLAGDTVNFSDAAATFADKNVGTAKTVTISGITAGGTDAGNYSINTLATTAANITPLAIAVSATGMNRVYDGSVNDAATLASGGVFVGDTVNFSDTSAVFADKNVGTAKAVTISGITASGADSGNYTLNNTSTTTTANITPLGIMVTGTAVDKIYDGNTTAMVASLSSPGVLPGDRIQFADTSAAFADKNVANGKMVTIVGLTSSGPDAANYSIISPSTTALANITPLSIIVAALGNDRVYDGTMNDGVRLASAGVVAGDNVVFGDASATFGDKNVGTAKTVSVSGITAAGVDAGNYVLANTSTVTTANIAPLAITVGGTALDKVYDRNTSAVVATLGSSGVVAGDSVTFADASATFVDRNAGTGKAVSITGISDAGADAGNYTLNNTSATTTASITPLRITVSGAGTNKVYDGTLADKVTLTSNGVLTGDVVGFSDASAVFGDKNVGTGKMVSISGITAGGADGGNYAVNATATTVANITSATLTETAKPVTVPLGVTPVLTGGVSGFVPGDTVGNATTGTLAWIAGAPAHPATGSYAITGTGLSAQNYVIVQASSNADALSITTEAVPQGAATERVYGLIGLPLSPDTVATPYGVGTDNERSNNTGNAKRDPDPASSNRRLTDFKDRTGLTVVGTGVRLPADGAM
jgi:hypothetical protein